MGLLNPDKILQHLEVKYSDVILLFFKIKLFYIIYHDIFSLAHLGKLLKNQLVCQKINLFSDEQTSVKVFTVLLHQQQDLLNGAAVAPAGASNASSAL